MNTEDERAGTAKVTWQICRTLWSSSTVKANENEVIKVSKQYFIAMCRKQVRQYDIRAPSRASYVIIHVL